MIRQTFIDIDPYRYDLGPLKYIVFVAIWANVARSLTNYMNANEDV
jgi:hypothetical protein